MLGKLAIKSAPKMANERFKTTRRLVENDFKDSLSLASSSLGWEAKIHLEQGDFERSLELYLDQHHGGDPSAAASIRKVIQTLFEQTDSPLDSMAVNVRTRQVISSYFVSPHFSAESMNSREILARWNKVLETNQVSDPVLAEAMVLSLYRLGQYEAARRWTKRASPESLMSRWILAKLELREGHTEQAIEIYSSLVRQLPLADEQDRFPRFYVDRGEYGLLEAQCRTRSKGKPASFNCPSKTTLRHFTP
jgi:tetratricopeptide (TPR) repeat protein